MKPQQSSSAFPLLLHDDNQRLILGSSAVADQSFDACAGVLIPGEMDEIGSDDPGFAAVALMVASGFKRRAKLCLKVADFRDGSFATGLASGKSRHGPLCFVSDRVRAAMQYVAKGPHADSCTAT